jgi:methionyl-tRNA formyltransferase
MKAVFVGAVESSAALLSALFATPLAISAVATLPLEAGCKRHADFADLAPLCGARDVPCHRLETDEQLERLMLECRPDLLLVWGWSRLVPASVVGAARLGGIGFHPAPLPVGRGRHPLIWSIVLGLSESAVTFFRLAERADAGEILLQRRFALADDEDARSLMDKVIAEACAAVPELVDRIVAEGRLNGEPQDERATVIWRKRSPADGRIDFRMTAGAVDRLVRALTRPYPGAEARHDEVGTARIWRVRPATRDGRARFAEPGRVIGHDGAAPVVACGEGAVALIEHEFAPMPREGSWFC